MSEPAMMKTIPNLSTIMIHIFSAFAQACFRLWTFSLWFKKIPILAYLWPFHLFRGFCDPSAS